MKRYVFVFFVVALISTTSTMACISSRTPMQGEQLTLNGHLGEEPLCKCPVEGEEYPNCTECYHLYVLANNTKYFIFVYGNLPEWEKKLQEMEIKPGDEIEVSGVLSSADCTDYIDLVTIQKVSAALDDTESSPAQLDITQPRYNTLGLPVNASYDGIVIQNGHKFINR